MQTRRTILFLLLFFLSASRVHAQQITAPEAHAAIITGTVEDPNGGVIPGATVVADDSVASDRRTITADDNGVFSFNDLRPAVSYQITIHGQGFADWVSQPVNLTPGQYLNLADIRLSIAIVETTVNAIMPEQLALQQVHAEEKQRILGVVPNFYVVYDKDPMPLTPKMKFQLAFKASTDPITIGGAAFLAGVYQAANTPDYVQGGKGYGQRFGAVYADTVSDVVIGGAILPSLLHQDPRYFYQGTGTTKSRVVHALSAPFVAKGDNGRWQFNASSIGGDLASGALSNLYFPESNRGANLVFTGALITTGGRMANALAQEFLLHRLTSKDQN
jgi:hypothetical protein